MPATPMNDAAERYSPEMAEAFHPTDTERPATKKSLAVLEVFAERKPIQTVTTTVISENARIHGSTWSRKAKFASMGSALGGFNLVLFQRDRATDKPPRDDPDKREEEDPEDQPAQREPGDPRRHQGRCEIIRERQSNEREQKRGG